VSGWRILRRWVLWPLLALLLLLPLGALGLLGSERGSAWLLRQAADLAPAYGIAFGFDRSSGSLLRQLELEGIELAAGELRISARHLIVQWQPRALFDRRLHVERIEAQGLRLTPPPAGDSEPGALQLPELRLPLEVRIDRLRLDDAVIAQPEGEVRVDQLALAVVLDQRGLNIRDLEVAAMGARLDGAATLQGVAPHALQGQLAVRVDESLSGKDIGPVEARATLGGSALRPRFDISLQAPTRLRLQGVLQLDRPQPGFDLAADWPALNWPLQGQPVAIATDGHLDLRGTAEDYHLTLRSGVRVPDLPAGEVALQGHGGLSSLVFAPLSLTLQDGRLQADGEVQWADGVRWQLALLADRLDPGLFLPDWAGELGGSVDLEGSLGPGGADTLVLRARINDLAGRLRGYPVSARGGLSWNAGRLLAEDLRFASGPNRVQLDGRADEQFDLHFAIDGPDLASLYPGLGGRLEGSGRLSGTPTVPILTGRLAGTALSYQELRVQELGVDLDWQRDSGNGRLRAAGFDAGGTRLDEVSANLSGRPAAHRLEVTAIGPEGRVELGVQGGLQDQRWSGTLQDLSLDSVALGGWHLQSPAGLLLGGTAVRADRLCLVQEGAQLCAGGGWDDTKGLDLAGHLKDFDLAGLASYLPGDAVVQGHLGGEFSLKGQADNPAVTFDLRPGDGLIRLEEAAQPFELAFRRAQIKGRFADDRGSAELRLEVGPNGRAEGRLTLGPEVAGQRALGGEVDAEFPDLGLVAGFVPAVDEVQGTLKAALILGGTLAQPRLRGVLRIADARARVPEAGVLLSDIDLRMEGDGEGPLLVKGQVRSGEGQIVLDGSVDPAAAGGPTIDLGIRGDQFRAVQLPEAAVLISPDLRLTGNGPYRLSGLLRIPLAAIELKELPSGTVSVSQDEIVVGDEPPAARPPTARNLTARVRVELGDKVSFKGFGLSTGLTGALDATVDDRGTLVDGKIELRDGHYKAYGQDLTVERGRLLFAGPPGNPDLELRAVRESRDGEVKAFLAMSGPLSKPRPRIYSEPSLPEGEALAYLVTGRGLDEAGKGEGGDIAAAALSLGLSRGEPLLQDMSDRLGLDELSIEQGEEGLADSSLVVGKYLNPDLYLGYSQGLFNPEGAVLLRLRLSDKLEVESRSGNEQSVDLFYRLEHN